MYRVGGVLVLILLLPLLLTSGCADEDAQNVSGNANSLDSAVRKPSGRVTPDIVWKSFGGPEGAGRVDDMVQDPTNPEILYIVTSGPNNRVYRSDNKGDLWDQLTIFDNKYISSLAAGPESLYACGEHIYDYNGTDLTVIGPPWFNCFDLFLEGNVLYAVRGTNQLGDTMIMMADISQPSLNWVDITPSANELSDLILPPDNYGFFVSAIVRHDNRLFASIYIRDWGSGELANGRIYYSDDEGETWEVASLIIPIGGWIQELAIDDKNGRIIAGVSHPMQEMTFPLNEMLFQSLNNGGTWGPVLNTPFETDSITDIKLKDSTLYAACPQSDSIIEITLDGEFTRNPGPYIVQSDGSRLTLGADELIFDPEEPRTTYVITGKMWEYGVVKSTDAMRSWDKMEHGIVASSPTIVVPHPTNPNTIYTTGNIIQEKMYTTDRGKTWKNFMSVFTAGDETRVDPYNAEHIIYMDEMTNLFESYTGGEMFHQIAQEFRGSKIPVIQAAKDGQLYVANLGIGLSSQPNYFGENWQHMRKSPDYSYVFRTHPTNADVILAAQSPRIFEDFSSIHRYDRSQQQDFGWKELERFESAKGITALEYSPYNHNYIFLGLIGKPGQLKISLNGGEQWDTLAPELTFTTTHAMTAGTKVYAAPWGDGIHTLDRGQWSKLPNAPFSVAVISVNPKNPQELIAADRTASIIWQSKDGGDSWDEVFNAGPDHYRLMALSYADDTKFAYVSTMHRGAAMEGSLFKVNLATGEGKDITNGLEYPLLDIVSTPGDKAIYVSTHVPGIFKSEDGGSSWKSLEYPGGGGNDLLLDEKENLYVASGCGEIPGMPSGNPACGIYRFSEKWELLQKTPSQVKALVQQGDTLVGVGADGAWRSNNAGQTWSLENHGLTFKNAAQVSLLGDQVYLGTLGGGVYSASIHARELLWQNTELVTEIKNIQLLLDPKNSDVIYATAYPGGVFKSEDRGQTWGEANFGLPTFEVLDPLNQGYYTLALDPQNSDVLYLGLFGRGVYKSTDGAATWAPLYGAQGQNAAFMRKGITKIVVATGVVYAASNDGIYVSTDDGENWDDMSYGLSTRDVRTLHLAEEPNSLGMKLYAGTNGYGIFGWDNGAWRHLGNTFGGGYWDTWERRVYQFGSFRFDPDVKDRIYFGHFPGGFFISEDGGHTWQDSSAGIGNDGLFSLYINPHNHDELWAGSYNGVVKSTDRGVTWEMKSEGMPSEQWVYTVAFDPVHPEVMYASSKNGQNLGFCERNDFCGVVVKSTNGGDSWFEIMDGLPERAEFYVLLIHPKIPSRLFLSTNKGVYTSGDSGNLWEAMNEGLPTTENQVRDNVAENLAFSSDKRTLLLALKSFGLWELNINKFS